MDKLFIATLSNICNYLQNKTKTKHNAAKLIVHFIGNIVHRLYIIVTELRRPRHEIKHCSKGNQYTIYFTITLRFVSLANETIVCRICIKAVNIVGVFLPLIMDEYDQIDKPIMTTVFNPLITRLWRINHM